MVWNCINKWNSWFGTIIKPGLRRSSLSWLLLFNHWNCLLSCGYYCRIFIPDFEIFVSCPLVLSFVVLQIKFRYSGWIFVLVHSSSLSLLLRLAIHPLSLSFSWMVFSNRSLLSSNIPFHSYIPAMFYDHYHYHYHSSFLYRLLHYCYWPVIYR